MILVLAFRRTHMPPDQLTSDHLAQVKMPIFPFTPSHIHCDQMCNADAMLLVSQRFS